MEEFDQQQKGQPSITSISIISGIIWLIIAALLIHFVQEKAFAEIFHAGKPFSAQLLTGFFSGAVFGLTAALMVRFPKLKAVLDDYYIIKQLKELHLSDIQIIQVSAVAGITEEILFRAAIQPIAGIWLTSLIFIGIHGYIRFQTTGQIIFTLFTFFLSMVLGWLFIYFGIIAAITAHAVYDLIVLWKFREIFQR